MAFNQLEKKDYMKTSLRAYFLQNGFNYGNYQGLGYANVLYPALRKMYKQYSLSSVYHQPSSGYAGE